LASYAKFKAATETNPHWTEPSIPVDAHVHACTPVAMTTARYKGLPVDLFFNVNWATDYAVKVTLGDHLYRFIPPESLCFFKIVSWKHDSKRRRKDEIDVLEILERVDSQKLASIDKNLKRLCVWGLFRSSSMY
jgi:hypothetical protein